jgi:drug/metabolite transporter (DMT)-like permease
VLQNSARRSASRSVDIVPSARLLGAFAFLVLGGSILAYLLWFHPLKVCGATAASAHHFLMPPLGMLFAWIVLGEHVEIRDLIGIVPEALGICLVTRPSTAARRPFFDEEMMRSRSLVAPRAH